MAFLPCGASDGGLVGALRSSLSDQLEIYAKTPNMPLGAADAIRCCISCAEFHIRADAGQGGSAKKERCFAASD